MESHDFYALDSSYQTTMFYLLHRMVTPSVFHAFFW